MIPLPLACTVRGCGQPLTREPRRFVCPGGHAFDIARSGYLNLGHRIDVEDEAGQALATVTFKSAVAVQG